MKIFSQKPFYYKHLVLDLNSAAKPIFKSISKPKPKLAFIFLYLNFYLFFL